MSSIELNKWVGAVLLAGLIAMLTSFLARQLVLPHHMEEVAYMVGESGRMETAAEEPEGPEPIAPLLASADVAAGERVARACAACHSFQEGESAKVGPNLWGIVNASVAHAEGFNYSAAMAEMGGSWGYESLNEFIYSPRSYLPGTAMTFVGLRKTADRANVIAWLRTLSNDPAPLPE